MFLEFQKVQMADREINDFHSKDLIFTNWSEGVEEAIRSGIRRGKEWKQKEVFSAIFAKRFYHTILAIMIAFFNRVSGINAIIYFAPRVFEMGISTEDALISP